MIQTSDTAPARSASPSTDARRTLVLTRPFNGIGDWLFALACLKFVNRQRPDVRIRVDFSASTLPMPPMIREAFHASDVIFTEGKHVEPGDLVTRDSLVYRKWPPDLYLESMVHHLNDQTGLGIAYEHGVYPEFVFPPRPELEPYVVMISHGKRRERHRKEWGYPNLRALSEHLVAAGVRIIQIGAANARPLPGASLALLGQPFAVVASVLKHSRAYIGLENGLMVLCGFMGVPQVTIYDGQTKPSNPCRVDFGEAHYKIPERIEPAGAADKILRWL